MKKSRRTQLPSAVVQRGQIKYYGRPIRYVGRTERDTESLTSVFLVKIYIWFYSQSVIKSILPFDSSLYAKFLKEIYSWLYLKDCLYALTLRIKIPEESYDFISNGLKKKK